MRIYPFIGQDYLNIYFILYSVYSCIIFVKNYTNAYKDKHEIYSGLEF